jgi:hypothetical protein
MPPSAKEIAHGLKPKPLIHGLTIQNIPTINLRHQYAHDRESVLAYDLADKIHAWKFGRTDGPATVTYPEPDAYYTMLLRSTIVGIECTLQASAIEELTFNNRLTEALAQSIRRPRSLSRSTTDAYYNKMAELVDPSAQLKTHDNRLWKEVCRFYEEIRNPLSHGFQLWDVNAESVRATFDMFDRIYGWIDSWADRDRIQRSLASTTFQLAK